MAGLQRPETPGGPTNTTAYACLQSGVLRRCMLSPLPTFWRYEPPNDDLAKRPTWAVADFGKLNAALA